MARKVHQVKEKKIYDTYSPMILGGSSFSNDNWQFFLSGDTQGGKGLVIYQLNIQVLLASIFTLQKEPLETFFMIALLLS
jgi:hypothetical protein